MFMFIMKITAISLIKMLLPSARKPVDEKPRSGFSRRFHNKEKVRIIYFIVLVH